MDANELLRDIYDKNDTEKIAKGQKLSRDMIRKWSEAGENHRVNFLERAAWFYDDTGDRRVLDWPCERANAYVTFHRPRREPKPGDLKAAAIAVLERKMRLGNGLVSILNGRPLTRAEVDGLRTELAEFHADFHYLLRDYDAGDFADQPPETRRRPTVTCKQRPVPAQSPQPPPKTKKRKNSPLLPLLSPLLLPGANEWLEAVMALAA